MSGDPPTLVSVPLERLRALELLETKVKTKATERLELLRKRERENPEPHSKKVLEKYHKNKEEINAKRREAYKAKKEAERVAKLGSGSSPGV